jgi:hypothetical protein
MNPPSTTDKIVAEHRADPGAAVRGLAKLFLCAASLAIPVADHTGQPEWRALVAEIEQFLARLTTMESDAAATAERAHAPAVTARRRPAA